MKHNILFVLMSLITISSIHAQQAKHMIGYVYSVDNKYPIIGATVRTESASATTTDKNGQFRLTYTSDTLVISISHMLYIDETVSLEYPNEELTIYLKPLQTSIEEVEVYATGYNSIPKERATGSFELLSSKQLNQSMSSNILDRLEGATGSLAFDRRTAIARESSNGSLSLRLRGLSTLMSDAQPLIIVNNFPFEGDLADINPNDVESIVFLKDAAASAIWGAKSANGVIVIQLKEAKMQDGSKSIQALSTFRIGSKPNFMHINRHIASIDFMNLEQELFERGQFIENNATLLSPYVYLLFQRQKGLLTDIDFQSQREQLLKNDIREQASQYLYGQSSDKVFNVSLRGGVPTHSYLLSVNYDDSQSVLTGNNGNRLSLRMDNKFQLNKRFTAQVTADYIVRKDHNNAVPLFDQSGIVPADKMMIYPYASLVDQEGLGTGMPIAYSPFFLHNFHEEYSRDWYFNALDELDLRNNQYTNQSLRLTSQLRYQIVDGLSISLHYNHSRTDGEQVNHYDKSSYYAKNMINRFIQPSGSFVIPDGDIRHSNKESSLKHGGRTQVDFNKTVLESLAISSLAGAELSQSTSVIDPQQILYNFDQDNYIGQNQFDFNTYYPVRPQGSQRIPMSGNQIYQLTDRFVSYYGLASFTWNQRYLLSSSLRWDASNLFGVKTNQKGVPLWSIGAGWLLHHEGFMKSTPFSELKIRGTIGENGNINKNATAYPTAAFTTSTFTGLKEALLRTAGNPQLKWERVRTWNVGLDWAIMNNKVGGSVDVINKDSYDLIGYKEADPTTGINPTLTGVKQMINYGKFQNKGLDIRLFLRNINLSDFRFNSDLSVSKNWNKVVDYDIVAGSVFDYFQYIVPASSGKSRDILYAFPWYGLDPQSGDPLVNNGTNLTTEYGTNVSGFDPEHLLQLGNSFPLWNGSFRNEIFYKDFSFSFLLTWKGAYKFRRSSINYSELIESWNMHSDYYKRWQKPGDESITAVPAIPSLMDRNRESYYTNSEILIEDGDHIRLQNIQLSYMLPIKAKTIKIEALVVMENLGLIWAKNKQGIDPEYHLNYYSPPKQWTLGLRVKL